MRALRARGFAADVWLADCALGYADNGTLFERLRDDVIAPAQRAGYPRIWLVGISLGGFASLGTAAPAAASRSMACWRSRPTSAGRPCCSEWRPPAARRPMRARRTTRTLDSALWIWLGQAPDAVRDKVHLYTGSDDRFIAGQRLFAQRCSRPITWSRSRAITTGRRGRELWTRWLERAPWPRRAA